MILCRNIILKMHTRQKNDLSRNFKDWRASITGLDQDLLSLQIQLVLSLPKRARLLTRQPGEYGLLYTAAGRIRLITGDYLPGCRVNKHLFTRKSG